MKSTLHNFLRERSLLKTGLILGLALNAGVAFSQTIINVAKPKPGFGLDGKVQVSGTLSGDWIKPDASGAESIFAPGVNPDIITNSVIPSSIWYRDLWNSGSDEIFGSGAKFVDDPRTMVITKGKPPSKNDIHNAYYHVTVNDAGVPYLMIAGDRYSTTGTSYIDFEFLQGALSFNNTQTGFKYTENEPVNTGGRTIGDIVVSMEYSGGGSTALAYVYRWELQSGVYTYVLKRTFNLTDGDFNDTKSAAATNLTTTPIYAKAFGKTEYAPYSFVEAALNLGLTVFQSGTGGCDAVTFKTIFIKTKASNSPTAALKDFIPPQRINLQLGGVTLSYSSYDCNTPTILTPTVVGTLNDGGTFSCTNSDLKFVSTSTGVIDYANSKSGTYTITFKKTINASCEATATASVTISNNAPVITCPGDKVVDCGSSSNYDPAATGSATASVPCGTADISKSDGSMTSVGCIKYFLRTWTATDPYNGLESTCVQKITIRDNTPPSASDETKNLTCGDALPNPPTATDNCSATIQVSMVSVTEQAGSSNCKNLIRKFVYVDESGNTSGEVTQTINFSNPPPTTITTNSLTTGTTLSKSNVFSVKAYPNPFNTEVNFDLQSSVTGPVKLVLFDIAGRNLGIVYQGNVKAGDLRKINIDGQKYGASTIIYQMMVGDQVVTGKLLKPVQQP